MKKKMNLMVILITVLISVSCLGIVLFLMLKDNTKKESTIENKIYGTVLELGPNFVKVESISDNKEYIVFTDEKVQEGDFIVAYYNKSEDALIRTTNIEVLAEGDEIIIPPKNELTTAVITTTEVTTTAPTKRVWGTTRKTTTTTTGTTTTVVRTTNYSDDTTQVVNNNMEDYFSLEYQSINYDDEDVNHKEVAKQKFINAVDFIFYGKTINGVSFASLTDKVKAKVIYYTLLMDSKIENTFPDYKQNLGEKYNDIKSRLIAKYMELVVNICKDNEHNCDNIRADFDLLKKSVNLSWTVLKKAFQFAYDKGASALVNWYEVYSGKRA